MNPSLTTMRLDARTLRFKNGLAAGILTGRQQVIEPLMKGLLAALDIEPVADALRGGYS